MRAGGKGAHPRSRRGAICKKIVVRMFDENSRELQVINGGSVMKNLSLHDAISSKLLLLESQGYSFLMTSGIQSDAGWIFYDFNIQQTDPENYNFTWLVGKIDRLKGNLAIEPRSLSVALSDFQEGQTLYRQAAYR